ncbi:MAG TPA: hypothetical protein VFP12_04655 [Allosphingosinicella sp.]|nr:hypothetical protein [Allosphingosinicella sp.]
MIVSVAALALLRSLAWESLPPPPPTEAERAVWSYEGCLWKQTEAERRSAPVSTLRAGAIVARAVATCRAEKAEALRKMLEDSFENSERGPIPGPEVIESHLVNLLQKPKATDATN